MRTRANASGNWSLYARTKSRPANAAALPSTAIREALDEGLATEPAGAGSEGRPKVQAVSRRTAAGFAALGALAAAPFVGGLVRLGTALASPSAAQDVRILQLVLKLEYAQVAFYEQALEKASLQGELREFARIALGHERAHLAAIKKALGSKAGPPPTFHFGSAVRGAARFTAAAIKLEDLAVAGYNGQATNLTPGTLAAAATIVSVEARHAAWIRALNGDVAAPEPVDKPMTAIQVVAGLREIGLKS